MLRTLILEEMTFGVFPYMSACFTCPWYYNVEEVFDAVLQVRTVLQVCKKRPVFVMFFRPWCHLLGI
jgi:thiol-disulfide isomerase/thioredoxin